MRDVVLAEAARDERDVGLLDRKVGELEALLIDLTTLPSQPALIAERTARPEVELEARLVAQPPELVHRLERLVLARERGTPAAFLHFMTAHQII